MEIRNLQRKERPDRRLIEEAVKAALEAAGMAGREVSVALVGDRAMTALNRRWTGRAGPTDVLAFPMEEGEYLGEVIISAETARRQAGERGRPFEREISLLVAHGVLHLAGFDHTLGPREEREMRGKERQALARLPGRRPAGEGEKGGGGNRRARAIGRTGTTK